MEPLDTEQALDADAFTCYIKDACVRASNEVYCKSFRQNLAHT